MRNKRIVSVQEMVVIGVFTALLIALSQVSFIIPGAGGVPLTLQTFAIAVIGFMLGTRRGVYAVAVYLLLGMVGIPVFASFSGGIARIIGPTGGFLIGFLPMIALCGTKRAHFAAAGLVVCHLMGLLWFALVQGVPVFSAFMTVSLPYLLKDAGSLVCAHLAARVAAKGLRAAHFPL